MLLRLFLLFTITTAVETYLLVQIGAAIGAAGTVALILLTGAVGSWMTKREGLSVFRQIQEDAQRGIPPADTLIEGLLVLIGGVLLITPGVLTDLVGFSLIAPWTRTALAPLIRQEVMKRVTIQGTAGGIHMDLGGPGRPRQREPRRPERDDSHDGFDHPVVD